MSKKIPALRILDLEDWGSYILRIKAPQILKNTNKPSFQDLGPILTNPRNIKQNEMMRSHQEVWPLTNAMVIGQWPSKLVVKTQLSSHHNFT